LNTAVDDVEANSIYQLYPNPVTNGSLTVSLPLLSNYSVTILTELGNEVYATETVSQKIHLPVSGFTAGFYFVRVTDLNTGLSGIKKVVIQ